MAYIVNIYGEDEYLAATLRVNEAPSGMTIECDGEFDLTEDQAYELGLGIRQGFITIEKSDEE